MPRKLTATTGVLLALVFAGCGKDEPNDTAAQSAATATTPAATTPATTTTKSKSSKSSSKTTSSKSSSGSKTTTKSSTSSGTKSSAGTSSTTSPKTTTTAKKPVGVTPASGSDSGSGSGSGSDDPSSGTGSGPAEARADVVSVLRRYYKAFIDKDGETVCSLLTSAGQDIMKTDGGANTCAASAERLVGRAGEQNITLLQTTRDGLHVDDITVTGNNAVAQIGETSRLRLVQVAGRWLVRSPNVTTGSE